MKISKANLEKVMKLGRLDTRGYRYIKEERSDSYHQWTEILRLPLSALDLIQSYDIWEEVWTDKGDPATYSDGWKTVRGAEVLVRDGIIIRGIKQPYGDRVTCFIYVEDGHGGWVQDEVTIAEYINGKGKLL